MPNYCECDLIVTGDSKQFKAFARTGDNCLDTNKFVPYPKKFKDMNTKAADYHKKTGKYLKDGFNSGGYEWCIKNWGTKWGIFDAVIDSDDDLRYAFTCAWSPPIPVILAMSKKFPMLEFTLTYFERGAAFNGHYQVKNGMVLSDETGKYFGDRGG